MPKIAFLFPGQGAQAVGMGRELDRELPAVRALFDRASEVLGFDLRSALLRGPGRGPRGDRRQPAGDLRRQPGGAREPEGRPSPASSSACAGAAGLSLGEYTALVFAGAIDFAAGLEVVRRRGQAMQAASLATPSGMTSVLGLDEAKVDELCRRVAPHGRLWKANMLGPGNIVVSGEAAALAAVEPIATELGAMKVIPLAVAGAFHSDAHEAGRRPARRGPRPDRHPDARESRSTRTSTPSPTTTPTTSAARSSPRSLQGVRWEESMRRMLADGFDTFYEIGPGRVLTGLLKRIDRKTPCTNIPAR